MDQCKGVELESDNRCPKQCITEDHCEWHQKKCVRLYKIYKKSSDEAYNTPMPQEMITLDNWKSLMHKVYHRYVLFTRAWNDRKTHRDLCYFHIFWDRGHDRQFEIIDQGLIECENEMYRIIQVVDELKKQRVNIIQEDEEEQDEYEDVIAQVKSKRYDYELEKQEENKIIEEARSERAKHDESIINLCRWFIKHYHLEQYDNSCICATFVLFGIYGLTDLHTTKFELPADAFRSFEQFAITYLRDDFKSIIQVALKQKDIFMEIVRVMHYHIFHETVKNNINGRIKFEINMDVEQPAIFGFYMTTEGLTACRTTECRHYKHIDIRKVPPGRGQLKPEDIKNPSKFYELLPPYGPGDKHEFDISAEGSAMRGDKKLNIGSIQLYDDKWNVEYRVNKQFFISAHEKMRQEYNYERSLKDTIHQLRYTDPEKYKSMMSKFNIS